MQGNSFKHCTQAIPPPQQMHSDVGTQMPIIAIFLSRINPYWSQEEWRQMMYQHLRLLTAEVAARIAGNYEGKRLNK
ncbi:hypothetical protein O0550_18360 [Brevibacillus halotolerans]|uniref:hypothetical protein n=1 Tax=Brevibacillus TaxID=55080 RepID=UPI00215CDAAD|nr:MULTISPECIES: hypothetical protein [Brevibacillus]MCR8965139.1 hypothetical protein [Brevibacillus laterosporus]MCZ0837294.1 hypothetical protein [Brevibacillus halotolerans]